MVTCMSLFFFGGGGSNMKNDHVLFQNFGKIKKMLVTPIVQR